jgi:TPR repeat protein
MRFGKSIPRRWKGVRPSSVGEPALGGTLPFLIPFDSFLQVLMKLGMFSKYKRTYATRINTLLTFLGALAVPLSTSADTPDMVGMPFQKDRDLATVWSRLVVETNSPLGTLIQSNIGARAISGRIQDLKAQAEKGVAEAQYALGYCFAFGLGVPQDFAQTAKWIRKAAEQGHPAAAHVLGNAYLDGTFVPKDNNEGVKWLRKSATFGFPYSQVSLGECYAKGRGVTNDWREAFKWFSKAAERGYACAQSWVGYCYRRGEGVPKDLAEAVKWFRKSAEQGDAYGQDALGWCLYALGWQHSEEAVKWFRKSADQGNFGGQFSLGWCFYYGIGVSKDPVEAVKWYRKSAEQGHVGGQRQLGVCLYVGEGVAQDYVQAYKWLSLAAAQGLDDAKHELTELKLWMTSDQITKAQGLARDSAPAKTPE